MSHPSTKLIEVRLGKQIVARSQGLSTRRNFVLLAHLSLVSSKSKQKSLFGEECQGMRVVYERCCGLDVHKKSVVACVLITPENPRDAQRDIPSTYEVAQEHSSVSEWVSRTDPEV